MRHVLHLFDFTREELQQLFIEACHLKAARQRRIHTPMLMGRVLALVFEKPSLRTRVSFQAAIAQMGGTSLFLSGQEAGLGCRESLPDVARTISQYVDAVVLRTFSQQAIEEFSRYSECPVINGLSDRYHPCQALADIFTMRELFGDLAGRTLTFVGDGNNVARSLAICCGKLDIRFILAAPKEYQFDEPFRKELSRMVPKADIDETEDLAAAVKSTDIVYTDVWTSMGQEAEQDERRKRLAGYQVNAQLIAQAPPHARVMHCLPARREEEITSEVLDGPASVVFQQAANRMHAQKALLFWLLS
jgi:ornithine carbamoyltransferase